MGMKIQTTCHPVVFTLLKLEASPFPPVQHLACRALVLRGDESPPVKGTQNVEVGTWGHVGAEQGTISTCNWGIQY